MACSAQESRHLLRALTCWCLLAATAGGALAQSNTTGAISGIVRDRSSGDALAGVTVVATSPSLQGAQSEISGADGSYKIDSLPPGTYLVTFYYSTNRVARRGIRVSLTRVTRVDQELDLREGTGEVIVIDAKAPSIDVTRTDEGITVDQDYLEHIPIPGRTFDAALGAAAGAALDSGGIGFSGSTSLENSYVIDGVNTTALHVGNVGTPLMNEFIEEIQILTGGYQAEHGRATGAVVNVITKSGTNDFHGSVFSTIKPYIRPRQRIFQETAAIDAATKLDYLADFGVELGGPLVKDKVWFYVGFAPRLLKQTVTRIVKRRQDCHAIRDDGTLSDCRPEYQDGLVDENPNDGRLIFEELERSQLELHQQQYQFVTKLNFALAPEHQGALSVLGSPVSGDQLNTVSGSADATRAAMTSLNTDVAAKWLSKLNDNATQIEALFGWHRHKFDRGARDPALDDVQGILVVGGDLGTYGRAGGESQAVVAACSDGGSRDPYPGIQNCPMSAYRLYSPGVVTDYIEDRKSGSIKVTQRADLAGNHELKAGVDVEDNLIGEVRHWNGGQFNVHNADGSTNTIHRTVSARNAGAGPDVCGFETGPDDEPDFDRPIQCTLVDEAPSRTATFNWAAFAQDSWSPRPNLTLNYGVRYEEQRLRYSDAARNTIDPVTMEPRGANALLLRNMWAPRAGVIYDWTRQGRSKVYGSFGRFYESMAMLVNDWSLSGDGWFRASWSFDQCVEGNASWNRDPSLAAPHPANCPTAVTPDNRPARGTEYYGGFQPVTPGTKAQYMDEASLGVQYELSEDLRIGAAVRRRSIGRVIEDLSVSGESWVIGNPGQDGFDEGAERALVERISELPDGDPERERLETRLEQYRGVRQFDRPRRDYTALELTAVKRFSRGFFVQGSYTLSATRGNYPGLIAGDTGQAMPHMSTQFDVVALMPNRDGPLPQDRTHQLNLDGYHTWDFGAGGLVTAGARFRALSGTPVDALGAYDYAYGAYESFLLPRGAFGRTELVTSTDLHLSYGRRLAGGTELRVFADIFNLFNQEQTAAVDEAYTYDFANPIVGGSRDDLVYLKSRNPDSGLPLQDPVTRNRNFGNTVVRYDSQSFQLGARLSF